MRRPVSSQLRNVSRHKSYLAPIRGLVQNQSPATPIEASAETLENWIPTDRGARVRGGLVPVGTTGGDGVTSVFAYNHPTNGALFAATSSSLFNMIAFDPDNAPVADITGQTSGYYSTQQIGTVGGDFLYALNGDDDALLFDGLTWQVINGSSSPVSITGVDTGTLSSVWLYRNRLFFVEKDTLNAHYLPVDSVGGAAQSVSLAGVFKRGGSLLLGATWSLDSGDGLDDKCVFISTEGEFAVYSGSDPSDITNWQLEGRYDVAEPLGVNGIMQAGGDLIIATTEGAVPISEAINKDPAALALSAVSRPIEDLWRFEAQRTQSPVELIKWPSRSIGMVTLPDGGKTLLVNLQTGAWGVQIPWVFTSATIFRDKCYVGQADGKVLEADEGGLDDGLPYTAKYTSHFDDMGAPNLKCASQIRYCFYAPTNFNFRASVANNFQSNVFPAPPNDAGLASAEDYVIWDVNNWDERLWWSPAVEESVGNVTTQWISVSGSGHTIAPQLQITSGSETKPNIELIRSDVMYTNGEIVV